MNEWWRSAVVYEVYPRSFQDSDGDGIGDLKGIERRLDYLQWLGVDAVWIAPFYPSPMVDFGYDVADYRDVHPLFGTMEDFDRLLAEAHRRGLRILIDFVPNHCSDTHPWFQEARASRDSPKRDWFVWRDPKPDGSPPNNWLSIFGGPAWTHDEATSQSYLHSFLKEQPDLNWRNTEVEAAMLDAMRFWLDRGVDGFRLDALWAVIKDEALTDNPRNPEFREGESLGYLRVKPVYSGDRPELMDVVRRMRALADSYSGERLLIGEVYLPIERLVSYYGENLDGVQLPFNFKLLQANWTAEEIDDTIRRYLAALPPGAAPNWVLGNHDQSRIASKLGREMARAAAVLLFTLPGALTLYYGDELGMTDVEIPPERWQDPRNWTEPGFGRDPERTPMLWDGSANAGFTTGEPWLPLSSDWRGINVEAQRGDPASMLELHRRLITLRKAEPALVSGAYEPLGIEEGVLSFRRHYGGRSFLIRINFSDEARPLDLPPGAELVERSLPGDAPAFRPREATVARLP
ncbi:MAG TPA: alpha-amylase family glycosyl hydrolase [Caulobacteraceae bacterium]|jgi:alpha-glucosidase